MVADDCWRPVQHGKQLVKGCAAAMPCPASGRHTREASLACKMHTYDRTHRTHSRIDKWGHHPTKVSNGWFAACLLQSSSMASCCSAPWWLDVRAVCLCVGCLPASCSSPGWGSRCMLGMVPCHWHCVCWRCALLRQLRPHRDHQLGRQMLRLVPVERGRRHVTP